MTRWSMAAFALGVLGLSPAAVVAEPVTFAFDVQITQRCTGGVACGGFQAAFPLLITFDALGAGTALRRSYSGPTFSSIPLERPAVSAGATLASVVSDSLIFDPTYLWRRTADASTTALLSGGSGLQRWSTTLYRAQDYVSPLPDINAASTAEFLGSSRGAGFFGYSYSDQLADGTFAPDSISYLGIATLASPEPVPEPATVLLLGSGLAMILRRKAERNPRQPQPRANRRTGEGEKSGDR